MFKTHEHLAELDAFIRTTQQDEEGQSVCGSAMTKMMEFTMTTQDLAAIFMLFVENYPNMDDSTRLSYDEVMMYLTQIRGSPFFFLKPKIGFKNRSSIGRFIGYA